jgi:hypothetical protein
MKTLQFKTQNQTVKAKIIFYAFFILYGICGITYSAVLLVKNPGHTGSINIYIIYTIFSLLFLISGLTFLFMVLSKAGRDDTDSKRRDLYASFRHSVTNLP